MKRLARFFLLLTLLSGCFLFGQAQGFNPKSNALSVQSSDTFSSWKKVSPEGAGFSLKFPGEPRSKEMIGTIEASSGRTMQLLQFAGGSIFYQITYFPISLSEARQLQNLLKGQAAPEDVAKAEEKLATSLLDEKNLTIGGYPAKDILTKGPIEGYGRAVSVVSDTHYYVLALGTKTLEAIRSQEAEYFLKSFTIMNGASASSVVSQALTPIESGLTMQLPEKPSGRRFYLITAFIPFAKDHRA